MAFDAEILTWRAGGTYEEGIMEDKSTLRKLSLAERDQVTGGKIAQTNGGGNEPNGVAVGIPAKNPAGHEPPGQQPSPPGQ